MRNYFLEHPVLQRISLKEFGQRITYQAALRELHQTILWRLQVEMQTLTLYDY